MLRIAPQNLLQFSECSYKSRQPRGGPAPFASFEDLSDYLGEDENALKQNQLHFVEGLKLSIAIILKQKYRKHVKNIFPLQLTTHLPRRSSLCQVKMVHIKNILRSH